MKQTKLITDKKEIEKLINSFFGISTNVQLIEELTHISNKEGCHKEYQCLEFKHELDEYDLSLLQQPMTDRHVLISATYHNSEAYITFEEFYEYLEKSVKINLQKGYLTSDGYRSYDDFEINQLLEKIKITLEV